ncbi:alpha/beta fold hydrolase [Gimibacter soli]|uniref:Alpha/beta fold hydrolase n=1 Tax=Gimibacter soli TaxID=3024400 RepID=A0AAE9XTE0_9PROT|nr:alpha/beta fold hydrolase [Gimibacter soli]WCL52968.1 alpha/beta fold hydrolase [Gimibacter soli]
MTKQLVFVPGLLSDRRLFLPQIGALSQDFDIHVAETREDETIEAMASRLLADIKGEFAVCGLSMGGYVVLDALRQAPQRITHFALMDTNAHADLPAATEKRLQGMRLAEQGHFEGVIETFVGSVFSPKNANRPGCGDVLRAMSKDLGVDTFLRQQRAIMARADATGRLKGYHQPALVLCGIEDALSPPAVHAEMVRNLPNADYHCLTHCGHMATLERPNAVIDAMRTWLAR